MKKVKPDEGGGGQRIFIPGHNKLMELGLQIVVIGAQSKDSDDMRKLYDVTTKTLTLYHEKNYEHERINMLRFRFESEVTIFLSDNLFE